MQAMVAGCPQGQRVSQQEAAYIVAVLGCGGGHICCCHVMLLICACVHVHVLLKGKRAESLWTFSLVIRPGIVFPKHVLVFMVLTWFLHGAARCDLMMVIEFAT